MSKQDAVKMGPSDISDGFLHLIQHRTGARLLTLTHPALAEIIVIDPVTRGTYLQNQAGHQVSSSGRVN